MNKILLIVKREYLTRIRKRSFIIMTILGPLLMAAIMVVPVWFATVSSETKIIEVVDESGLFEKKLKDYKNLRFDFTISKIQKAKAKFVESDYDGLLYIPELDIDEPKGIIFYSQGNPGIEIQNYIERTLKDEIEDIKLQNAGIDKKILENIKTKINITTINLSKDSEKDSNAGASAVVGYIAAFLIYFFIFLYGVQVMRGVMEEKNSRIIEVIISSVRPFQLMIGKITGIGLIALTQFMLWIIIIFGVVSVFFSSYQFKDNKNNGIENVTTSIINNAESKDNENTNKKYPDASNPFNSGMNSAIKALTTINFPLIITSFIFFFLGGYLLYGALFAAVGAAVDNETDTQQFLFPITIPLLLAIIMAQVVIKDPNSSVTFWLSIIPLTSPIIMMIRLPFDVPFYELILSMVLLIIGFLVTTWFAAKIYRVGILMYGKKVNYKEIFKWLFYN